MWFPAGGRTEGGDSPRGLMSTDRHRLCVNESQPLVKLRHDARCVSIPYGAQLQFTFFCMTLVLCNYVCLTQSAVRFFVLSVNFWNASSSSSDQQNSCTVVSAASAQRGCRLNSGPCKFACPPSVCVVSLRDLRLAPTVHVRLIGNFILSIDVNVSDPAMSWHLVQSVTQPLAYDSWDRLKLIIIICLYYSGLSSPRVTFACLYIVFDLFFTLQNTYFRFQFDQH